MTTIATLDNAKAQNSVAKGERSFEKDRLFSDSIFGSKKYNEQLQNSKQFYDSIYHSKSKFVQLLAPLLITSPSNTPEAELALPTLEVGRHYYSRFENQEISKISIIQANVFQRIEEDELNGMAKFLDKVHILTKERQIKQNLLFKVGDKIDPYKMSINEELLRSLPFVANAYIIVQEDPESPDDVVVKVFVRDKWTISADASWFGDYDLSIFDKNFLGSGNELVLKYYFPMEEQANGFEIQYNINNAFGTFADLNLEAGVGYTNNKLKATASRKFILPSDHIWGFTAGYEQYNEGISTLDSIMLINKSEYGLWYGYSWCVDPNQGTTIYATTGITNITYNQRPPVWSKINPFYHNHTTALVNIGISRQNFFQGNMIYGYGRTEDIPFGYKFEVTGGVQWGEFSGRRAYIGGEASWGDLIGSSYLNAKIAYGSFIDENGYAEQGVINSYVNYFSPLINAGAFYIRQFLYGNATWGLNRLWGEREQISYNSDSRVRGMWGTLSNNGSNRLTLGGETVFFTPLFIYNFRFAFYFWGDIGFLGYDPDIFKNDIASSIGIGVRIKNERLIFNNIQIRLGFSLRRPDGMGFETLSISDEKELRIENYRPETPSVIDYY